MMWELIKAPSFLVLFIFSFSLFLFLTFFLFMLYTTHHSIDPGGGARVPMTPLATQLNPMVISLSRGQVA